jgi:hypothetical protein
MTENEFNKRSEKLFILGNKITKLISEKQFLENELKSYQQYHRPSISISIIQKKYYHCTCRIYIGLKAVYHTAHLGKIDLYSGKTDERLIRLADSKIKEILKAKYPEMFT